MRKALASIGGAAAGYTWYALVGCTSGGCIIWSNPLLSALAGAVLGWAIFGGASAADEAEAKQA